MMELIIKFSFTKSRCSVQFSQDLYFNTILVPTKKASHSPNYLHTLAKIQIHEHKVMWLQKTYATHFLAPTIPLDLIFHTKLISQLTML
jgi:hypothetical protein